MLLGFIAGVTILLGLPIGRLRRPMPSVKLFLNAVAVGILLFLVWDVLSAAWEPIDAALGAVHDRSAGLGPVFGYGALFVAGLAGRPARPRRPRAHPDEGVVASHRSWGDVDGGASTGRVRCRTVVARAPAGAAHRRGHRLAQLRRGLAIGQASARDEVALATLLVVGFAVHNATEGFGIVAPLAGDVASDGSMRRPGWGFLLAMALIGGGRTFVGTAIGHGFTSDAVSVVVLTLAAGSIIYVVTQLLGIAARAKRPDLLAYGVLIGLLAGFATDAIVTAAGA